MTASTTIRRIAVGADHGGFHLKEAVKAHLTAKGFAVEDVGAHSTEAVDYPVFAHAIAQRVATGAADVGVMVDRAGIGSAMAANKLSGVRAALCYDLTSARNSREHNNANVLTLGAGLIGPDLALQIVDVWLATRCEAERHLRRAAMIDIPATSASCGCGCGKSSSPVSDAKKQSIPAASCACSCGDDMTDISAEDLDRVARRVAELAGGTTPTTPENICVYCQTCGQTNPEHLRELIGAGAQRLGHRPGAGEIPSDLAKHIDHTLLRPDATTAQIDQLCDEAAKYGFASVCVNPTYVRRCADRLKGSSAKVCSVIGFPFGAHVAEIKALETRRAIRDGADEIDMVINIGALKSGDDELVYRDIRAVVEACRDGGAICKVIIEIAMLTDEEKVRACVAAKRARAHFVKTSTGYGGGGATARDVALMGGAVCGTGIQVKAAGGIRSLADAQQMIAAGATRLGASAGVKIVQEAKGMAPSSSAEPAASAKY